MSVIEAVVTYWDWYLLVGIAVGFYMMADPVFKNFWDEPVSNTLAWLVGVAIWPVYTLRILQKIFRNRSK